MEKIFTFILVICSFLVYSQNSSKYSPEELLSWQQIGKGNGFVTHGQFLMEEVEGSKGFMILSPEKYKDVVLRYEVMTMNPATVLVALINASDNGESTELKIKENSDSFGFWTREVEDYMFGFRVMAHNTTPFIRKHPALEGENTVIGLAEKDVMRSGWRHLVECGKNRDKLWLKIDGETVIDVHDKNPHQAGKILIRVRGTANDLGKCLIRNLEIIGDPV